MVNVFISYSHDSVEHKKKVLNLAKDLKVNSINVFIDQFDINPGAELPNYMEKSIKKSNRVLVICTEKYCIKADSGINGVGYEKMIISSEIYQDISTDKFIPIIMNYNPTKRIPVCMGTRMYLDFTNETHYKNKLKELIQELQTGKKGEIKIQKNRPAVNHKQEPSIKKIPFFQRNKYFNDPKKEFEILLNKQNKNLVETKNKIEKISKDIKILENKKFEKTQLINEADLKTKYFSDQNNNYGIINTKKNLELNIIELSNIIKEIDIKKSIYSDLEDDYQIHYKLLHLITVKMNVFNDYQYKNSKQFYEYITLLFFSLQETLPLDLQKQYTEKIAEFNV